MGKVANARRKSFFDKLMKEDIQRQKILNQPRAEAACCLNKYKSKLPDHFVKCYNCPLDKTGEV